MSDGKTFGELALLTSKPRAATIITKGEVHFATLDAKDYKRIIDAS